MPARDRYGVMTVFIGTAGWSISRLAAAAFGDEGSGLERYASRFGAVEVNSSFYRPHRQSTWARWADAVPADFRFAVKIPKEITHQRKLADCREPLMKFVDEIAGLGPKLALLLIQLPPKLAFEESVMQKFFELLASLTPTRPVCEPRHPSWFTLSSADEFLQQAQIPRVAADPAPLPAGTLPGGWRGLSYWRLHGSPQMYRSAYGKDRLEGYADLIETDRGAGREVWCMFDNTASSAAIDDALQLRALVSDAAPER
jgi:uncharacterized protein YecE (DUF72 family)